MSTKTNYVEIDLTDFGGREIAMMIDLLKAYREKDKTVLFGDIQKIGFNKNSGNVFLLDEDMNVAMDSDGVLLDFLTCPECGNEGLNNGDFVADEDCCKSYVKEILPDSTN